MNIHPLLVFAVGAAIFFVGVIIMTSVYIGNLRHHRTPQRPDIYRLSIYQPGDYDFKVYRDGTGQTTQLNRVR